MRFLMLPLSLDYPAMEARRKDALPEGPGWQYEPKWDGFRCLVFKDGDELDMRSKSGKDLARYFPEVKDSLKNLPAHKFVLDGEIVLPQGSGFSFDLLLQRIHPAASRIKKLSVETPAQFVLFDILATDEGESLVDKPFRERREALAHFAKKYLSSIKSIFISPSTENIADTQRWRAEFRDKLDGIVAKKLDMSYQSGNRNGMVKFKWMRSADCVIGGFRYEKDEDYLGSLLLGLYDSNEHLIHIGFCSSFTTTEKRELTKLLEPHVTKESFYGGTLDTPSRWQSGDKKEWMPVSSALVAEFSYDHFSDGRFRHGTKLLRWRPDKSPEQCTFEQIK
jgi:ATP-dependent DNA ligase